MIKAYINYPNPHVTIHRNPNCSYAKVDGNQNQRHVLLNTDNLSKELKRFRNIEYRFGAEAASNDMWLILDFQDSDFEVAVVGHLKRLLGLHHRPIEQCEMNVHC